MALTFPLTPEEVLRLASVRNLDDFFAFSFDGPTEFAPEPGREDPAGVPGTFEELLALPGKAERVDGRILAVPPSNSDHSGIQLSIGGLLGAYVAHKGLGRVYGETFILRLNEGRQRSPDVSFFRTENLPRVRPTYAEGGADLVVEIVSPSSVRTDRIAKRAEYAAAGIEEYWIVDPARGETEFLRLEEGAYLPAPLDADGRVRSSTIEGFWVRPEWPLSNRSAYDLVAEILAAEIPAAEIPAADTPAAEAG